MIPLDDVCLIHHCERVKNYFGLDKGLTVTDVLQWCSKTYCTDNLLLGLIHAIDTVIAGYSIRNKFDFLTGKQ